MRAPIAPEEGRRCRSAGLCRLVAQAELSLAKAESFIHAPHVRLMRQAVS